MNLTSAINQAMESDGKGKSLRSIAQDLSDLIGLHPELRYQAAAALTVMMMQPGLDAHRAAWADDQDNEMFEAINSLCPQAAFTPRQRK
jgi:hypothetical protein